MESIHLSLTYSTWIYNQVLQNDNLIYDCKFVQLLLVLEIEKLDVNINAFEVKLIFII